MTVWIANYAGHPYDAAKRYGELRCLTKGYVSFQSLDRVKYQVGEEIVKTAAEDWLLLSGTSTICVLAALLWLHVHNSVNLLIWDERNKDYREVKLTQENLEEMFNAIYGGTK